MKFYFSDIWKFIFNLELPILYFDEKKKFETACFGEQLIWKYCSCCCRVTNLVSFSENQKSQRQMGKQCSFNLPISDVFSTLLLKVIVWNVFFLVRIFPHLDWIWRDNTHQKKLRIWTIFAGSVIKLSKVSGYQIKQIENSATKSNVLRF